MTTTSMPLSTALTTHGFAVLKMPFSDAALARMEAICRDALSYEAAGATGRVYTLHQLVEHGVPVHAGDPVDQELIALCALSQVTCIIAEALNVSPDDVEVPDLFVVRMRAGDRIGMHTHRSTLSLAMVVTAGEGGAHQNVDATTGAVHEHHLQAGWAVVNLGPTPHAVDTVASDRVSIVWNGVLKESGRPRE